MNRCRLFIALGVSVGSLHAQVGYFNDQIGVTVGSSGAISIYASSLLDTVQQIDRVTIIAGYDSTAVLNYREDYNTIIPHSLADAPTHSDYEIIGAVDNSWSMAPPDFQVLYNLYGWISGGFSIFKFTIVNMEDGSRITRIGSEIIPKIGGLWGNETVAFDLANQICYQYKTGSTHLGFKFFSHNLSALKFIDYSSGYDSDALLWTYLNHGNIDALFAAGPDGAVVFPSIDPVVIGPGDSVAIYMGVSIGSDFTTMVENMIEVERLFHEGWGTGDEYGTGVIVEVPAIAPGSLSLDGIADEPGWTTALNIDILANWDGAYSGHPDVDIVAETKLLWTPGTLFVFVLIDDNQPLYWYPGGWGGEAIFIGVDGTHAGDNQIDNDWSGWPQNAPDKGPVGYTINQDGITLDWGNAGISPQDSGWVRGTVFIDDLNYDWGIEMAVYVPQIRSNSMIGFNIGGAAASQEWDDENDRDGGDYAYFSWQFNTLPGGDVVHSAASFGTLVFNPLVDNIYLDSYWIDDDNFARSAGNDDGIANPGEFLEIYLTVANNSGSTISAPYFIPDRTYDPFLSPLQVYYFDDHIGSNDIPANSTMEFADDLDFYVDAAIPAGHILTIPLALYDGNDNLISADTLRIPVSGTDQTPPLITDFLLDANYVEVGTPVTIGVFVQEGGAVSSVEMMLESPDEFVHATVSMHDDGQDGDDVAGDRWYGARYTPDAEHLYYVDIRAIDAAGNVTEIDNITQFTSEPFVQNHSLLLVANAATPQYDGLFVAALQEAGYQFDTWSRWLRGPVTAEILGGYLNGAVVWICGTTWPILTTTDRANIASFLDTQGKLVISGQDLGYDLVEAGDPASSDWYADYLHANYIQDDIDLYSVYGVPGQGLGEDMQIPLYDVYTGGTGNGFYPDEIAPRDFAVALLMYDPAAGPRALITPQKRPLRNDLSGKGLFKWPEKTRKNSLEPPDIRGPLADGVAAIGVNDGTHRLVYFAFGLEAVADSLDRALLLSQSITWLGKAPIVSYDPIILSINDVPEDQGRWATVRWAASTADRPLTRNQIGSYSIWIKASGIFDGLGSPAALERSYPTIQDSTGSWIGLGSIDATQDSVYGFLVHTFQDSNQHGINWSYLKVSAHASTDPNLFYFSAVDSGYSIDNIAPGTPGNLVANVEHRDVLLSWVHELEEDFAHFAIYRGLSADFIPDHLDSMDYMVTTDNMIDTAIVMGVNYFYRISAVDFNGNYSDLSGTVSATVLALTGTRGLPDAIALHPAHPNPFNPSTIIRFDLPEAVEVYLVVYDLLGREVASLADGRLEAGYHSLIWNGRNARGREVPTGMYIVRLVTAYYTKSIKLVLLK